MLELRPGCENCNKALPPDSGEAMICTFECTFCTTCVSQVLKNVCPNCGGGFSARPIRPANDQVGGYCLINYPASTKPVGKPVNPETQRLLIERIGGIDPAKR